jgi:4-amino-4-deoxy-L-arabinose transferase-like glycosyltransferase
MSERYVSLLNLKVLRSFCVILMIFAVTVLLRIPSTSEIVPNIDQLEYLMLSKNISENYSFSFEMNPPFHPTIYRGPLYPAFISIVRLLTSDQLVNIVYFQILLQGLCSITIFVLLKPRVRLAFAIGAAFVFAICPGLIIWTRSIHSETLYTFMLILSIFVFDKAIQSKNYSMMCFCGILLGLSILCRSNGLFLIPPFLITICHFMTNRFALCRVFILGLIIALAPWTFRNYRVSDKISMSPTSGALAFYIPTHFTVPGDDYIKFLAEATDPDLVRLVQSNSLRDFVENRENLYMKSNQIKDLHPYCRLYSAKTPQEYLAANRELTQKGFQNIINDPKGYIVSRLKVFPTLFLNSNDDLVMKRESYKSLFSQKRYFKLGLKLSLLFVTSFLPILLSFLAFLHCRNEPLVYLTFFSLVFTLTLHFPLFIEYRYWVPMTSFLVISSFIYIDKTFLKGDVVVKRSSTQ